MPNARPVLERIGDRVQVPQPAFDRLVRRRDRKRRNHRIAAGVVGIAVGLAAILAGASLFRSGARPPQPAHPSTVGTIAFTKDWQVFVAHPDGTVTQITHGDGSASALAWSPDGSRLLVWRDEGLWVMDADGTSAVRLADLANGDKGAMSRNAHFSPDGTKIAYQSDRDIFVMDADGRNRIRITDDADAYFWYGIADFSWSPDGTRIAFAKGKQGREGIFTVRPDGTGIDRLPTNPLLPNAEHPVWSPDGSQIAFSANSQGFSPRRGPGGVFVMDVDGSHPVRVAPGGSHTPIWSPDGSKIAVDENGTIYIVTPDGTLGKYLLGCGSLGMDWSTDSEHLVVIGKSPSSPGSGGCGKGAAIFLADAVFTSDANGPARTRVVHPSREAVSLWPLWQPAEVTDAASPS